MNKLITIALIISVAGSISGCESMKLQPYSPVPDGVSIAGSQASGYRVDSIKLKRTGINASPEALEFCFAQNIPGITGSPVLNPSKTKIAAQGRDQVSFIIPMTMGTPLNYDILFSATESSDAKSVVFDFTNIRIKGTWSANEAPLPASQEAHLYVESALDKFNRITDNVANCLRSES
jgi:hypothetical protein